MARDRGAEEEATSEWIAGSRPGAFRVLEPTPFRPRVALVMDATSGWLFGIEALPQDSGSADVAEAIVKVMHGSSTARESAGLPRTLRVEDPVLADALRSRLSPEVTIRVAPTPELDAVMGSLARHLERGEDRHSDLEADRVTPETIRRFFEAAAAVYRFSPWRIVQGESQVLRLDAPAFGVENACLSVIGGLDEHYGVLVFESVDDFSNTAMAEAEGVAGGQSASVPVLSINFGGRKELPRGLARETKRHAWPVAGPRAYPWILAVDVDGLSRPTTERDYAYATALLEALAVFLGEHAAVFEEEPASPIARTVVLDGLPDAPSVTLTAPHPEADWDWLDGDPVQAARWAEADDLADRFVADQVRNGRSSEWLRSAQVLVEDLFRFKVDTADEASVGWTAKQVEEFLLDYFPSLAVIPPEDVQGVPEQLEAFFVWLADQGYESPPAVRDIRARIARKRSAFLERALHPAPASPRSLGLEIRKSGIDTSDEAALAAFISKWSADVEAASAAPPARTSKRWTWTPGSPAPDPAAACPCGSGVRYRKCCMPR